MITDPTPIPIPIAPREGLGRCLESVDREMAATVGDHPAAFVQARAARAQVYATCALVHAVRDLTDTIRSTT